MSEVKDDVQAGDEMRSEATDSTSVWTEERTTAAKWKCALGMIMVVLGISLIIYIILHFTLLRVAPKPATKRLPLRSIPNSNASSEDDTSQAVKGHEEYQMWNSVATFGHSLLSSVRTTNENIIVSPVSVHLSLGMASFGADASTKCEMNEVLEYHEFIQNDIKIGYKVMTRKLFNSSQRDAKVFKLNVANRIYLSSAVDTEYKNSINDAFGADAVQVDFQNNAAQVTKEINAFVEKKTAGLIQKLLDQDVKMESVMVLINALYFKGSWTQSLLPDASITDKFNDGCGRLTSTTAVDWLTSTKSYAFRDSRGSRSKMIEIPYSSVDRAVSLVIILPDEKCIIKNWFITISWETICNEFRNMTRVEVDLRLPRFNVESMLKLENILPLMGMTKAFRKTAKFPFITGKHRNTIKIDSIVHKAKLKLDEFGTEAAAATAVEAVQVSARIPGQKPIPFHVTRSFYFALIMRPDHGDRDHILPMFTGIVYRV